MKEMYTEYYAIAEQYNANKNYGKALEYYNKAKGRAEFTNISTYKMAVIYAQTGDYESSAGLFQDLLEKDPHNSSLLASLAYVYAKKGSYDESIALYEQILLLYPYDVSSIKNLIILYNHQGNKEKAMAAAQSYNERFPHDTKIFSLITEDAKTDDSDVINIDIENVEDLESVTD